MNTIAVHGIVLFLMLAVPASSSCGGEDIISLQFQCLTDLDKIPEFKENVGGLETLQTGNPQDHKMGCCMERALASCYKSKQPSGCSPMVDHLISKNQQLVKNLGGGPCNYDCPSGSLTLKPTWVLTTAAILAMLLFKKDVQ